MAESFNKLFSSNNNGSLISRSPFIIGRIVNVVQGPYLSDGKTVDPDYNDVTDLGKIRYSIINSSQNSDAVGASSRPARPFFSFIHQYPLEGEYVYLLPGPGLELNEAAGDIDLYYLPPIRLWGSPHHNAHPDMGVYSSYININTANYQNSQQGTVNNITTVPMEFPLGNGFVEKSNIKSILPFTGDVIIEGRYGTSIRFGSTAKQYSKFNTWSNTGNTGDPITIIRNGQGNQSDILGYNPTVENINVDQSSIYLTAGQTINIDDISNFPLTSWDISVQNKITIGISLSAPPTANTTISAQDQDAYALDNPKDDQVGTPTDPVSPIRTYNPTVTETTLNTAARFTNIDLITPTLEPINPMIQARVTNVDLITPTLELINPIIQQPTTPISGNQLQRSLPVKYKVVGDSFELAGTYVVNLRAVDRNGTIVATVSKDGTNLQAVYNMAVSELRNINTNSVLTIPPIDKLEKL